MHHIPFETVGLNGDAVSLFCDCYDTLTQHFVIEQTGHIDFHLEEFESLKHYSHIHVRGSYVLKNVADCCYILFVENRVANRAYTHQRPDPIVYFQCWAITYVKNNFGRVAIRKETFVDKLLELVTPVEIDFEDDKAFSKRFYVTANDRQKAINSMTPNFRKAIMNIPDDNCIIEINDHALLISNRQTASPQNALTLCNFLFNLVSTY